MKPPVSTDWPWPAPKDDGLARHLVRGLALPDIALPATRWGGAPREQSVAGPGRDGSTVNLARRPGTSVIFVYPWTGRPGYADPPDWDHIAGAHGSTPQAEGFRDHLDRFTDRHIGVFGLSGQDTAHHAELAERLRLPFVLLSDANLAFARALDLPTFETGGITYLRRLSLVVTDGRIQEVIYPVHPPPRAALDVIALLMAGA